MDYSVFEGELYRKGEDETEQAYMERLFKSALTGNEERKNKINELMGAKFGECSVEERTLTLCFHVEDWMLNPSGTMHGGLMTTTVDMTMGMLARYYKQANYTVTAQLSMNFMRALKRHAEFHVCAKAEKVGRRTIFLRAEIIDSETEELAATATALFM